MKKKALQVLPLFVALCLLFIQHAYTQDSLVLAKPAPKNYKNVIRYNLSGPLMFGSKYMVFGYERVLSPKRSFSVNVGRANLPKLVSITTDSFAVESDRKNSGFNISFDYRFYLARENKYNAPRGLYIGPYYSFNNFKRDNDWKYRNATNDKQVITNTNFNIHTIGFELGYQFVFWNRLTLDLVMVGPGFGYYDLTTKIDGNLTEAEKEQLRQAVSDVLSQKFPGMDFVFDDKELNSNGALRTWTFGYRYMFQIGFRF
ncbi:hypothetical protein KJS94_12985 [Flavihumibacter rivuli]|uniref:hypothetical protein n=1 Tax=Flavihumibacter rivuli TaxID=2838156 RepID=UPI001BDF2001|nr:hypothetical protein [Flavihumibacter rivuli]ULQ55560.1 hypothetical protein KJS94_12985 [Flavihumibacter rivuli]